MRVYTPQGESLGGVIVSERRGVEMRDTETVWARRRR
jgi:hypothetical protein